MTTIKDQIVEITRRGSASVDDYWMAKTAAGRRVGIFLATATKSGQFGLMRTAGYTGDLSAIPMDGRQGWNNWPIDIEIQANGEYWTLVKVEPRPEGAEPDQPLPDWDIDMARAEAVGRAVGIVNLAYDGATIWDSETTGTNPEVHEIIEIGVVAALWTPNVKPPAQTISRTTLIHPKNLSRLGAVDVHGITPDMLKDQPTFPEAYDRIASTLTHGHWIGWNIGFDGSMLINMCRRYGLPPIMPLATYDVMSLFGQYVGDWRPEKQSWRWFRLTEAAEILGIEVGTAHRAADDAVTTFRILEAMAGQAAIHWEVVNRLKAEREAKTRGENGSATD